MRWGSRRRVNWSAVALTLAFAFTCTSASAADPLLSGYAGPGGGEQVLIGSKVLPAQSGDGGLRRQTPVTVTSEDSTPTEPKAKRKAKRDPADATDQQSEAADATVVKPTYPNRVANASAVPLASGDVIPLIGGGVALGAVALFFRRNKNSTT